MMLTSGINPKYRFILCSTALCLMFTLLISDAHAGWKDMLEKAGKVVTEAADKVVTETVKKVEDAYAPPKPRQEEKQKESAAVKSQTSKQNQKVNVASPAPPPISTPTQQSGNASAVIPAPTPVTAGASDFPAGEDYMPIGFCPSAFNSTTVLDQLRVRNRRMQRTTPDGIKRTQQAGSKGKKGLNRLLNQLNIEATVNLLGLTDHETVALWLKNQEMLYGDKQSQFAAFRQEFSSEIKEGLLAEQLSALEGYEQEMAKAERSLQMSIKNYKSIDHKKVKHFTQQLGITGTKTLVGLDVLDQSLCLFPQDSEVVPIIKKRSAALRASARKTIVQANQQKAAEIAGILEKLELEAAKFEALKDKAKVQSSFGIHQLIGKVKRLSTYFHGNRVLALQKRAENLVVQADQQKAANKEQEMIERGSEGVPLEKEILIYGSFLKKWSDAAGRYQQMMTLAAIEPGAWKIGNRSNCHSWQVRRFSAWVKNTQKLCSISINEVQKKIPRKDIRREPALAKLTAISKVLESWQHALKQSIKNKVPIDRNKIAPIPGQKTAVISKVDPSPVPAQTPTASKPSGQDLKKARYNEIKQQFEHDTEIGLKQLKEQLAQYEERFQDIALMAHQSLMRNYLPNLIYDPAKLSMAMLKQHLKFINDPRLQSNDPIEKLKAKEERRKRILLAAEGHWSYFLLLIENADRSQAISPDRIRWDSRLFVWNMLYTQIGQGRSSEGEIDDLAACTADRMVEKITAISGGDRQFLHVSYHDNSKVAALRECR